MARNPPRGFARETSAGTAKQSDIGVKNPRPLTWGFARETLHSGREVAPCGR